MSAMRKDLFCPSPLDIAKSKLTFLPLLLSLLTAIPLSPKLYLLPCDFDELELRFMVALKSSGIYSAEKSLSNTLSSGSSSLVMV